MCTSRHAIMVFSRPLLPQGLLHAAYHLPLTRPSAARPLHLHTTCNTSTRRLLHAPPTHLSARRPHRYAPDAAAPSWCCLCMTQVRSVCTEPSTYATDFPGSSDATFEQAGDRITYKHSQESIKVSRARVVLPIVSKPSGIVSERPKHTQIWQARQKQAGGEDQRWQQETRASELIRQFPDEFNTTRERRRR